MISDEFPSQGKERRLSNDRRAQVTIPSPSIVPEQSFNLEILKQIKDAPPKPAAGTTKDSHPYWKNR